MTRQLFATRELYQMIQNQRRVSLSYNDISAHLGVDRNTAIAAVKRLKNDKLITVELGSGRAANTYTITDKQ